MTFLLNMIGTAALYWAIMVVQARWLAARPWPLWHLHLDPGLLIFWAIIR